MIGGVGECVYVVGFVNVVWYCCVVLWLLMK